jgi:type VI secretion system protein ImpA
MPTPDLLAFDTLLAPIGDDAPTGSNPRKTAALAAKFDRIREAFVSAAGVEKQEASGDGGPPSPPGKLWGPVIAPATELLTGQTKDLEVANWLAQALIRVHGLRGLRDGLRLTRELTERYWDGLHPLPGSDDEDLEPGETPEDHRPLFVERLQTDPIRTALRLAPITDRKGNGPFSYSDYVVATRMELTTGNDDAAEEGRQRKARIVAAATESGQDYYVRLIDDLTLAAGHMDGIDSWFMEKTGGLLLGKLRETLGEIDKAVRDISRGLIPVAEEPVAEPAAGTGAADRAPGPRSPAGSGGGFRASGTNTGQDRESALRCLAEIAAFFKATEPHSPIGYTLDTLITRARMPLPALLEDLISDSATREAFLTTAGIRLPSSS